MTPEQEQLLTEMHMKHLEMLQGVIARMASNSANLKNYCMTISAAIIGLAAAINRPEILYYTSPLILIFGVLDGQYLRLERAFRDQFNSVRRAGIEEKPDFSISPSWTAGHGAISGFLSWSVWLLYLTLVVVFIVIAQLMN
ncbi:hypothetical protein [Roseobacter sp.]|uniref:hypothetical protein n=1 Tax=Roseobacter sp. TaxID=1907202 RepID=UPI002966D1C8|nr:hypothetical protein [Roseobacter sp.]MDW3182662.1 hypothetical protein [Roseobacter sp.]